MEKELDGANRISKVRRIPQIIKKLGGSQEVNENNKRGYAKTGDNIWLEAKNIHSNRPSKKLDQKRYGLFKIFKNIR